jgi:hypothetical protein
MSDIFFTYDRDKDVWCLLNKGKSSNNSPTATKTYQDLVSRYGEDPTAEQASIFIDEYIKHKGIDMLDLCKKFKQEWALVEKEYHKRAERVFGVALKNDITVYITVNNRCPYNIQGNYFFVSAFNTFARRMIMHELWHFYTWQRLGADVEERLGKQGYNDIKESLTVLLNSECADLLPEGVNDAGYPQHHDLRDKVFEVWNETKNIKDVWSACEKYYGSDRSY